MNKIIQEIFDFLFKENQVSFVLDKIRCEIEIHTKINIRELCWYIWCILFWCSNAIVTHKLKEDDEE